MKLMEDIEVVFERMCLAARQGGTAAKLLQGNVQNLGKAAETLAGDSDRTRAMREAKTIVDEIVQEIILLALAKCFEPSTLQVDAEEDSPSLILFPSSNAPSSIIIDPIDATLEYLEGDDSYSVCIAVVTDDAMRFAIEYFPKRDVAYALTPDQTAVTYDEFSIHGTSRPTPFIVSTQPARVILQNRRVQQDIADKFVNADFKVEIAEHFAEGLLRVARGEAAGFLLGTPQMRDIMIGPIIAASENGFMCDWSGEEIMWPKRGRVPEVFVGNRAVEKEIRSILS